jgi:hypothetical protein
MLRKLNMTLPDWLEPNWTPVSMSGDSENGWEL